MSDPNATPCPACGAPGSGAFCGACGARRNVVSCPGCGAELPAGARFCAACGSSATGAGSTPARSSKLPWMVALVLSAVAIAAVVYAAGNREGAAAPAMANAGNVAVDNEAARNIDLSTMTPREQFARLNDRVMAAASTGDTATVIQFWPMAQGAYQNLLPGDRDIDTRYHMATLHLLLGDTPSTLALADTIMTESADNLIGWYLRAVVAEYEKDTTAAAEARREFLASFESQMATGQDEYVHHADMLQEFRAEGVLVP